MITINRRQKLISKPLPNDNLGFGTVFTDHMFVMDYSVNEGWHNPRVDPYEPISLYPSAMCLHYAQAVFEGMKAYKNPIGKPVLFRPYENLKRLNNSCKRMCIPVVDENILFSGIQALIMVDKGWIPNSAGSALYIRPLIIGTSPSLGVKPSDTYKLIVMLSPVGPYFDGEMSPIKVMVETQYVRACKGGVGDVKTSGNYAASILAQSKAIKKDCSQVLWLDAYQHKYIQEAGNMNIFFIIDNDVITPALDGTILPGVTRDSVIRILNEWNIEVFEKRISIEEIISYYNKGLVKECFGTGTAVSILPISNLIYKDNVIIINDGEVGRVTSALYESLTSIQNGTVSDPFDWIVPLK